MRNPKTIDDWIWRLERINFMQDEILSKICIPLLDELKGEEAAWFRVKFKSIMNYVRILWIHHIQRIMGISQCLHTKFITSVKTALINIKKNKLRPG